MKCHYCANEMKGIGCADHPDKGYAYNLFQCDECAAICKEDVWDNKGQTWIPTDNTIKVIKENPE